MAALAIKNGAENDAGKVFRRYFFDAQN